MFVRLSAYDILPAF